MYFQTLDDKRKCIGIYKDGKIFFDDMPTDLQRTWSYTGSISDQNVKYAFIYSNGKSMEQACPEHLKEELAESQKKIKACLRSFQVSKVSLRDHCVFDMIPHRFLMQLCEIRNKITQHVFENYEKPRNYVLLSETFKLLHKIKYQELNLDVHDCRHLQINLKDRQKISALFSTPYVNYNLFGASTGRLTTHEKSFPILTLKKEFRKLIKPQNDWFVQLDYNSADVRTFIHLVGEKQPQGDVHEWNRKNLFDNKYSREESKKKFFAWLFNPDSDIVKNPRYNREEILSKWYKNGTILNPYKRQIKVDERKALSYLVQSTTNDRILDRAIEIDELLKNRRSYISFFIHDEIAIDFAHEDKDLIPQIKNIFESGGFKSNISVGKNYFDLKEIKV